MTKFLMDFARNETGAAAAEYALILAIVGAGIAGAAFYLGSKISTSLRGTGDKITQCGGTSTTASASTC